jgi:hypothetical protein
VTLPDGFDGIGFTYTAPDGTYTIGGLPAGNYKVRFEDVLDMIGDQWWNGQPDYASANLLQLPLLGTTATANATLPVAAGGITGRVTDAVSGQPIEGICADAFDASTGDFISNDTSDVNGNYRIGDLPSGSYKIGSHRAPPIPSTQPNGTTTRLTSPPRPRSHSPRARSQPG